MATTWDWQSIDRYDPEVGYEDSWESIPTYEPTPEEVSEGAGDIFYLPEDYWTEDEGSFWSEGIYDVENVEDYLNVPWDGMTTDEIQMEMLPPEEIVADKEKILAEEEKDSFWAKLLGNKDLMSILAQAGLGALSGYSASRETKPTTRTTGGGGTPTSTAMLRGVGRAVQR